MEFTRGSRGRNNYFRGRGNATARGNFKITTGPPRLETKNPSSDQIDRWLNKMKDYLEGEGNVIKTIYTNIDGNMDITVEKMSSIFGNGSVAGRYPIVTEPVMLGAIPNEEQLSKEMRIKKWDLEWKKYNENLKGITVEKSVIAGILKSTINFNVKEIMRKSPDGRNALDDPIGKPMEIINVLKTTDFSTNASSTLTDDEKYFNAYLKFNNREEFKQNYDESLNNWSKRFKNEVENLKLLATKVGKISEVPSELTLANLFLERMNGLYNKLRDDLDKGLRKPRPTNIEEVLAMAVVYDKPSTSQDRDYRGAYVVSRGGRGRDGRGRGRSNIIPGNWKCKVHGTDTHEYNDEVCKVMINEKNKREETMIDEAIDNRRQYFANHTGRYNGGRGRGRFRGRGRYRG